MGNRISGSRPVNPDESVDSHMSLTVLVVDDEQAVRQMLVDVLLEEGYTTLTAENGADAIEVATARRPDLVLSDVMMPGLDGVTLAAVFARWDPPVPVVLMSAIFGPRSDGTPVLPKPFDLDDMLAVVAATMDAA